MSEAERASGAVAESDAPAPDGPRAEGEEPPVDATTATDPLPQVDSEADAGAEGREGPTRLFSLGDDGGAPLAVVFKRRRSGGRRRAAARDDGDGAATGRRADPRSEDAAGEVTPGERIAEALATKSPAEDPSPAPAEYDVVLTDAYRVPEGGEPPPSPGDEAPAPTNEVVPAEPAAAEPESPPADGGEAPASVDAAPAPPAAEDEAHDDSLDSVDDTEPSGHVALADLPLDVDPLTAMDAVLGLARRQAGQSRDDADDAWYRRLFGNEYLLAHPMRSDASTENEVAFIEEALGVKQGARLLDLGCGYGRHAIRLARHGYDVVGLDLSMEMLERALTQAQSQSLSIKFVHGDMRDLNFREVFDGAICFDTSFGYFSEAENLMVLRGVHDALKRGGRLVLDVVNRDHVLRDVPQRNWWEGDGCLVQEDIEFDHDTSRLLVKRFVVFADGVQREYDISLRLFSLHELRKMLHLVGFDVLQVSGGLHTPGAFFGPESNRIIVLAEKVDRRRRR